MPHRLELGLSTTAEASIEWGTIVEVYIGRAPGTEALEGYTTNEYRALLEQAAFAPISPAEVAEVKVDLAGDFPVALAGAAIAGPAKQGDPEDGT